MSRRRFGSAGAWCAFLFVVVLTTGGLAWVTAAALNVEYEQRLAVARADQVNQERIALWRLDAAILPTVFQENNRPFQSYSSPQFAFPATVAFDLSESNLLSVDSLQLLSAKLPVWMKLHFQMDPDVGFDSPQVLTEELAERLSGPPANVILTNATEDRQACLENLSMRFPLKSLLPQLAEQVGSIGTNDSLFAASIPVAIRTSSPKFTDSTNQPASNVPAPRDGALWAREKSSDNFGFAKTYAARGKSCSPLALAGRTDRGGGQNGYESRVDREQFTGRSIAQNSFPNAAPSSGNFQQMEQTRRGQGISKETFDSEYEARLRLANGKGPLMNSADGASKATSNNGTKDGFTDKTSDLKSRRKTAETEKNGQDPSKNSNLKSAGMDELKDAKKSQDQIALPYSQQPAFEGAGKPSPDLIQMVLGESKLPPSVVRQTVQVGPLRSLWLTANDGGEELVLIRAARLEDKTLYQGVLLDWPLLKKALETEVADKFPEAQLVPVRSGNVLDPQRSMTAIPAELDPGPTPELPHASWTPLRLGLSIAWTATLAALAAVWIGGRTLLDLSERRIRFVSAVTHELRTPLTSLRLYLDLLTSGMVSEEKKREEYLQTLSTESDRLNRLIENVLDFARLEKRNITAIRRETNLAELLNSVHSTWKERCAADGKEVLLVSTLPASQTVTTDSRMAAQILGNLIDNARKYSREASDPRIWIWAKPGRAGRIILEVEDRGPGVAANETRSIFHPFRRGENADTTAGGAGLGLALAKQWAEILGGKLAYHSAPGGTGACFRLELPIS